MNKKKSFNRKYLILIPILVIAALTVRFFGRNADFLYTGTVEVTQIDVSSRLASVIASFPAKEGRRVEKGDLLVQMSCEDIKLNADLAKRNLERATKLFKIGSLSSENFDQVKNRQEDTAIKREWCSVVAPKAGTVLTTYREEGEYVNPGTKLLTLANTSEVWTVVYVPQLLLAKLSLGMDVKGFLPELSMRPFDGQITYISEAAEFTPKNVQTREERTRLVFGVKVTFSNPDGLLKPGMSLEVKIE